MDEIVDRLNSNGTVVGTVTRHEVREHRLPHRCAYVLVFRSDGALFIHQRAAQKAMLPLYWDVCVGGVPAAGEPWDLAARRELAEEIGVDAPPEFLFPFRHVDELTDTFGQVYRVCHNGPFRFQADEVAGGEFVPLADLDEILATRPFCPDGISIWRHFSARYQASVFSKPSEKVTSG